jgi:hypothetical protein
VRELSVTGAAELAQMIEADVSVEDFDDFGGEPNQGIQETLRA